LTSVVYTTDAPPAGTKRPANEPSVVLSWSSPSNGHLFNYLRTHCQPSTQRSKVRLTFSSLSFLLPAVETDYLPTCPLFKQAASTPATRRVTLTAEFSTTVVRYLLPTFLSTNAYPLSTPSPSLPFHRTECWGGNTLGSSSTPQGAGSCPMVCSGSSFLLPTLLLFSD
jgi:hypothetical protein